MCFFDNFLNLFGLNILNSVYLFLFICWGGWVGVVDVDPRRVDGTLVVFP